MVATSASRYLGTNSTGSRFRLGRPAGSAGNPKGRSTAPAIPASPGPLGPGRIDPADHIRLVFKLALHAAHRYGGDKEDWVGRVWLIVVEACQSFDPARGTRFSTYACNRVFWKCMTSHRREERKGRRTSAVDWEYPEVSCTDAVLATHADAKAAGPDSRGDERRLLEVILASLDERESVILTLRARGMTLDRIGVEVGLSKERVRQLEARALGRARALAHKVPVRAA